MNAILLAQLPGMPLSEWVIVGCAVAGTLVLVVLFLVSTKYLAAAGAVMSECRNATVEMRRWSEIAQRQLELSNSPLLKVVGIEEVTGDQGRAMKLEVRNVGFGSAVNVKCVLADHSGKEYVAPQIEIVGNETVAFEPPLLIESVESVRLEYRSQGGCYAHTSNYIIKSAAQKYSVSRVR